MQNRKAPPINTPYSTLKIISFLWVFLSLQVLTGQQLPPIQNYQPREYHAENQNWGITQAANGWMYFANNGGLLEFNGAAWKKYPSPNGSVLRSVQAWGNRIYSGCYMEFGYWERDAVGEMKYTSLSQNLKNELQEDEQFWKISTLEDWVLFQSLQRIYAYRISDGSYEVIPAEASRAQLFTFQNAIYFQREGGLFKLEDGNAVPLVSSGVGDFLVVGIARIGERVAFITEDGTFLGLSGNALEPLPGFTPNNGMPVKIYNSIPLKDGHIALGTISQGVFILDKEGTMVQHLNKENGLNNNTVLALAEDRDGNLWLGLDNGISIVNRSSAFLEFNDPGGRLGVVYAAVVSGEQLYLGTNQGLFRRSLESSGDFEFVEGTEGQVWGFRKIDGTLFCGHNQGTFVVEDGTARLISDHPGTWDIKRIPGRDSLLLQGNYQGLSVLVRRPRGWVFRNTLPGFDISSRFFEFTPEGYLVVNHEYKGVYTLEMDDDLTRVSIRKQRPPWGVGASLFRYRGNLCYATDNAFYEYASEKEEFTLDSAITSSLMASPDRPTGILVPDPQAGRLWGFGDGMIHYLDPGSLNSELVHKRVHVPSNFRPTLGVIGFECLAALGLDQYLIGRSNGFVILDLSKIERTQPEINITAVLNEIQDQPDRYLPLQSELNLPYDQANVSFEFNVPEFGKYKEIEYQYRLKGFREEWGDWSTMPLATFSNLSHGEYNFEVRARVGEFVSGEPANYIFSVMRPWYFTYWAMGGYVLGLLVLSLGVHRLYQSYYRKEQRRIVEENKRKIKQGKLKTKKKIMEIRNAQLRQEIDSKNRELAVATMSLIKRNEFLNTLKDELKSIEHTFQIASVIRTIDRNLSNEDDWKFFEEAFNNADKDFLKKVKELHSDLTPNDLKLCAYLRLNLSSKEIAPLLNISVRSVEVKRYRLRKKMDLEHEKSLTEYILEL